MRAAGTAGDVDARQAVEQRRPARWDAWRSALRSIREQLLRDRQRGRHLTRGEQSAVPDLHETRREDVQEEPAEEFLGMQRGRATGLGPKCDGRGRDGDESLIREADAMGVVPR